MQVRHDAFDPPDVHPDDGKPPSKEKSSAEGPEYWDNKAKEARARREYEEEEIRAKEAREGKPDSPFQVKGEVNLGKIDFQQQQEELRNTITDIQAKAEQQIQSLNERSEHYRDELHAVQIKMVEDTLKAEISSLQKVILDGQGHRADLTTQLEEISKIAGILGYAKAEQVTASEEPASLRLQILKMEMDDKQRDREFKQQQIVDERNWQLQLKKLEVESAARRAEIEAEKEKREMWVSPFEAIGAAIAKGMQDSGGMAGFMSDEPEEKPKSQKRRVPSGTRIQAGVGEAGVTECPECGEQIAIAPTSKKAICAACEASFPIERVEAAEPVE